MPANSGASIISDPVDAHSLLVTALEWAHSVSSRLSRPHYGRHWVRVELSTILIKYAFKISIQFWSRRDNLSILSPGQGLRTRAKRTTGKHSVVPLA